MNNMTQGSPLKHIVKFAIPLLIGNLFQQFYSLVDAFMVGQFIGVHALAAVGSTGALFFLFMGFIWGSCGGLSVITAQRFGAGDMEGMRRSVVHGLVLGIFYAVILTAITVPLTRPILELMNTPAEIIDDAYSYLVIIFAGIIITMAFNLLSNWIRALGDSRTPLYFLIVACVINIILDYVFIVNFNMGVAGVAWATLIAQLSSVILCFLFIWKKFPQLHIHKSDWKLYRAELYEHIRVSVPMGFQNCIIAIGSVAMSFMINGLGAIPVAAVTAGNRIDQMAIQPMISFAVAMSTFAAQNYGAKRFDRIRQGFRQIMLVALGFAVLIGILIIFGGYAMTGWFVGGDVNASQVQGMSQQMLRLNGFFYTILAASFVFRFTLQGLGRAFMPMVSGFLELIVRVLCAIFLVAPLGFLGVIWANPIAWFVSLLPVGITFIVDIRKMEREALQESAGNHAS